MIVLGMYEGTKELEGVCFEGDKYGFLGIVIDNQGVYFGGVNRNYVDYGNQPLQSEAAGLSY